MPEEINDTPSRVSLALSPDAEIKVVRRPCGLLIEFAPENGQQPAVLDPDLASMILQVTAKSLPLRKLPDGFSLGTISWSAVCILARHQLGGGITVRAIELNRPLSRSDAQATLRRLAATARGLKLPDPYHLGRALSTCVFQLGDQAGDLYEVTQPLRRTGEVTGILQAA